MGRFAEEAVRGAIWLRPEGYAAGALEETITAIRERYGGPAISPHVSLGSGIECAPRAVDLRLEVLVAELPPLTIQLDGVDWHDDPWGCLCLRVERTPELLQAHRTVCAVFGMAPHTPFRPHVSLMYGAHTEDRKRQVAMELDDDVLDLSFEATSIHFVNQVPEVPVEQWRSLYERPLAHRFQELVAARERRVVVH
jgi:hypothetical protein